MTEVLPVHLYGHLIGELDTDPSGYTRFRWAPSRSLPWELNSRILSENIPLGVNPSWAAADSFFGALLPEGQWRANLAREIGCADSDTVEMLARVGRDTIGALSIGVEQERGEPELLDSMQVAAAIRSASGYFAAGGGSSALPGFQRKIALTRTSNGWVRGHGNLPSTHIFKPEPDLDNTDAHRLWLAESYMLDLGREIGVVKFASKIESFDGARALVIERYDRVSDGHGAMKRLHQEDFAQALGLAWVANAKFESSGAGASLSKMARLLDRDASAFGDEFAERSELLRYVTFNTAIGNTDAHAKNYALVRNEQGRSSLAPLYDPTPLAYNYDGRKELALFIGGQRLIDQVRADHLVAEAEAWGVPGDRARQIVSDTLRQLDEALQVTPAPESIHSEMNGYIRERVQNLASGNTPHGEHSGTPAAIRAAQGKLGPAYPWVQPRKGAGHSDGGQFDLKQYSPPEVGL